MFEFIRKVNLIKWSQVMVSIFVIMYNVLIINNESDRCNLGLEKQN